MPGYLFFGSLMDFSSLFWSIISIYKPKISNFANIMFVLSFFIFKVCLPIYLLYYTSTHDKLSYLNMIKNINFFMGYLLVDKK